MRGTSDGETRVRRATEMYSAYDTNHIQDSYVELIATALHKAAMAIGTKCSLANAQLLAQRHEKNMYRQYLRHQRGVYPTRLLTFLKQQALEEHQ